MFLSFAMNSTVSVCTFLNGRHYDQTNLTSYSRKSKYNQMSPFPYTRSITSNYILNSQWFYAANSNISAQYFIIHKWFYSTNYNIYSHYLINHQWFYAANYNGSTPLFPIFQIKNKQVLGRITPYKLNKDI